MDSAGRSGGDETGAVVGVVDRDTDGVDVPRDLEATLDSRGVAAAIERGDLETVLAADPALLVTVGERSLSAVARARADAPVLPAGSVAGIESVAPKRLPDALAAALEGDARERDRGLLTVEISPGDEDEGEDEAPVRERALFDVTLVTAEPASISEYSVRCRGDRVATFRADGVVVATPAGSHGYAAAVEGPQLSSAVDAVAVSPIAPFVTRTQRWVLPDDDLRLAVERDEGAVTVVADEREIGAVSLGTDVTISVEDALSTLVVSDEFLADG
ncbi:NAD(+)/NADH kinase [Halopiger aswanensis]|uniref:NAD+ kinase n=1 Tax=Halopiger aswanensis TaxID=148449 RepID=A0A3R7HIW0_9EURY|nr:NAD(+)/NADH kinase [Halopiger aswanensis]RKD95460.1 NAD+ kinase [Halopiger aswanensis]